MRSAIKEFYLKKKIIVPIGISAINLVSKSIDVELRSSPPKQNLTKLKHRFSEEHHILNLPYLFTEAPPSPQDLEKLHQAILSTVISLKYRVLSH